MNLRQSGWWAWPVSAALLASCQVPAAAPAPGPEVLERIRLEIGEAPCTTHAQCRTLPIGHRACGGPAEWRAWSEMGTSEASLKALAEESAAVQRAQNERSGQMSTCQVLPDPGAACMAGRCSLRQRNAAN